MIVLLICFVVGCGWYFVGVSLSFNQQVYVGKVAVVGRVTDSISEEKYSYTIILDDVKINGESGDNISVRVTNCYDLPQVGSFISFESELENVHAFTLGNFNTSCYRSGVRYYADCNFKYAVVTEGYQLFDEQVRLRVKGMLEQNMSYENAQTAYASLFGDKNNLDGEVYANYNGAGILHILTVSGLHVSFLISLIFGLLELCRVNKYVNFAVTTVFIIFYAYLCNWTPSVLRAGIMGIVFMLSKLLHRKYDSLNALGLAGFIICLTRPLSGLDVGFLMSVFCVIGINMVMPIIKRALIKILPKGMSEALAISIAAQIGIFPIVCLIGGGFNVLSLFTNLIVVPFFGIVYPLLFSICFISLLLPFVGKSLIVIDWAFTFIGLVAQFFNIDQFKMFFKGMKFINILLFYVASFIVSDYLLLFGSQKLIAFSVAMLAFAFSVAGSYFYVDNLSTISYISQYGQSSVILKNSAGQTMVIGDCYLLDEFREKFNASYNVFVANGEITSLRYDALQEENIGTFISHQEGAYSENYILEANKDYMLGSFKLIYLSSGDDIAGVRVEFDDLEIFIASEKEIDYNEFEKFNNILDFDFVFANYPLKEGKYIHVARKFVEGCDYSFNAIGNMGFDREGNLRRLD